MPEKVFDDGVDVAVQASMESQWKRERWSSCLFGEKATDLGTKSLGTSMLTWLRAVAHLELGFFVLLRMFKYFVPLGLFSFGFDVFFCLNHLGL
ncbi:hypothetical protein ES332_A12G157300v1 [Gossypium tomentosum]|uniref:Uncharacterized protein n=1 Tax=Gossypium tomentosum TaxID=34277 RepID=A0A5D2MXX6_GOSTO|nr:hypothetical protein ES332_A12G157300v1 [Gossypium tomentosum]